MENFEQRFNKLPGFLKNHITNGNMFENEDKNFQMEVYESAVLIGSKYKTNQEIDDFKEAITPNPKKYTSLVDAGLFYSRAAKLLDEIYPETLEYNISRPAIMASFDLAKKYVELEKKNERAEAKKRKSIKATFERVRDEIKSKTKKGAQKIEEVFNTPSYEKEKIGLAFDIKDRDY